LKGKCNSKRAGKRISQIVVRQRKGTFFGKEVFRVPKAMPGGKIGKGLIM
jgi:hypothetical protein